MRNAAVGILPIVGVLSCLAAPATADVARSDEPDPVPQPVVQRPSLGLWGQFDAIPLPRSNREFGGAMGQIMTSCAFSFRDPHYGPRHSWFFLTLGAGVGKYYSPTGDAIVGQGEDGQYRRLVLGMGQLFAGPVHADRLGFFVGESVAFHEIPGADLHLDLLFTVHLHSHFFAQVGTRLWVPLYGHGADEARPALVVRIGVQAVLR